MTDDTKLPKESTETTETETLSIDTQQTVCATEFPSGCIDVEQ